jgi:hypothetical protein
MTFKEHRKKWIEQIPYEHVLLYMAQRILSHEIFIKNKETLEKYNKSLDSKIVYTITDNFWELIDD